MEEEEDWGRGRKKLITMDEALSSFFGGVDMTERRFLCGFYGDVQPNFTFASFAAPTRGGSGVG